MTFPVIAGSNSSSQPTNSTSHTVNLPASISAGNMLIVTIILDNRPTVTGDLPDNWTQLTADSPGNDAVRIQSYFRRATGSEGGSVAFTTSAAQCSAHRSYRITGAHESTNPFAGGNNAAEGSTSLNLGAVNPSTWDVEDTLWLAFIGNDNGTITITAFPTSYTDTGQFAGGNAADGVNVGWATRTNAVASEDPSAFTLSSATSSVGTVIAIRPSAVQTITPSSINASVVLYSPVLQLMTLVMESINVSVLFYSPSVDYIITPSGISASVTMNAPTVTNLSGAQNIDPNSINAVATMQSPTIYHVSVVTRNVIQGSDDGGEPSGGAPNMTGTTVIVGAVDSIIGIRFQNVQVPQGAQLVSAVLNLTLGDTSKNDAEGTWYCQDEDNPPTFAEIDGDFDTRIRTSGSASWTTNDLGSAGATVATPSLLSPTNDVIMRSGWVNGNSIVYIYKHNSAADLLSLVTFEHASLAEPQLVISYLALVDTIFPANISASATMNAPNVGAGIETPSINTPVTMQAPTINLQIQYIVVVDRIVAAAVPFPPIVASSGGASLRVELIDVARDVEVSEGGAITAFVGSSDLFESSQVILDDAPETADVMDQE